MTDTQPTMIDGLLVAYRNDAYGNGNIDRIVERQLLASEYNLQALQIHGPPKHPDHRLAIKCPVALAFAPKRKDVGPYIRAAALLRQRSHYHNKEHIRDPRRFKHPTCH